MSKKIKIKTLQNLLGDRFRVIAPYHEIDGQYFFCNESDGYDDFDQIIPLRITKNDSKDWFKGSHMQIQDKKFVSVYINSGEVLRKMYNKLDELNYLYEQKDFEGNRDGFLLLKYESLLDEEVLKILKPATGGKSFGVKSAKHLPSYNPKASSDYKIKHKENHEELTEMMKDKFGDQYLMSYKKIYKLYKEKYGVDLTEESGHISLTPVQFIDARNIYYKIIEIIKDGGIS